MIKMRKVLLFCLLFISSMAHSQVEQGDFLVDVYGMGPTQNTFAQMIWPNAFNRDGYRKIGASIGVGGKAEYMLIDKLSIGIEANYAFGGFQYRDDYYDQQTNMTFNDATYKAKYSKFRGMIGSNFYFVSREIFTMYTGIALGYYGRSEEYTVNEEPSSKFESLFLLDLDQNVLVPFQIPMAGRVRLGSKFFLSENLGAMIEIGVGGGAFLEFGVAGKF